LVGEGVGGFHGCRPEEDEYVHGAFEAAGDEAEDEDALVCRRGLLEWEW
jgi:hypothetical protein